MHVIAVGIIGALATAAASLVGRVLLALGMGFVTFTGVSLVMDTVKSSAVQAIGELPARVLEVAGILQIDTAVNILFSALVVRSILQGLTSGSIKRLIVR